MGSITSLFLKVSSQRHIDYLNELEDNEQETIPKAIQTCIRPGHLNEKEDLTSSTARNNALEC